MRENLVVLMFVRLLLMLLTFGEMTSARMRKSSLEHAFLF